MMTTILPKTPEAVLDFWMGPMRSVGGASRDGWRERMLKWRIGPFARSAEDRDFFNVQRHWCERIHLEGFDSFFAGREWETTMGTLAKIIVLDQFPRCVYRGTPLAYANDPVTGPMARSLCDADLDMAECNVMERFWVYVSLSHSEELEVQELCVSRAIRWSADLVAAVPSGRRRISQYVGWSFIRAFIEHSEVLLSFGRFPHRNAILGREHKAGEPRYLTDTARPRWSFTQPPHPGYFAILAALYRIGGNIDERCIRSETLAELHRAANLPADGPDTLMDVPGIGSGGVPFNTLYRHMHLRGKERALSAVRRMPLVEDLFRQIKGLILKDPRESWPPKSAQLSVEPVIDVAAMRAIVAGDAQPEVRIERLPEVAIADPDRALSLVIRNDSSQIELLAREVAAFADRNGVEDRVLFEIQLALEEWVMTIINYGYDTAAEHEIRVTLQLQEDDGTLFVDVVDDGREFDPLAAEPEADFEAFLDDRVEGAGVAVRLMLEFVDDIGYRRRNGCNHLTMQKSVRPCAAERRPLRKAFDHVRQSA
ncbi:MAG: DUF924 family protein [Boseongicola sp.]|nr:DUF924 family protein [Boseongicola sp.]